jgi:N-acetylmuramic acid 6-phosphate etherase
VTDDSAVNALPTEQVLAGAEDLDTRSIEGVVDLLLEADARVPVALARARDQIHAAARTVALRMELGGRLVYVGAGTPGRLGAQDAAEIPPTYGVPEGVVLALVAGGQSASHRAVEGAEDDAEAGAADLTAVGVTARDVVVGISASGRTPYVLAALEVARASGAATVAVVNNAGSAAALACDCPVEVLTGPEVVAGSTRMNAGTAQKVVLNVLSTTAMVHLGKTWGPWMVDVQPSNHKLRLRARRILCEATGAGDAEAQAALEAAGGHTKTALLSLLAGVEAPEAARRLAASGGRVREALRAPAPGGAPA